MQQRSFGAPEGAPAEMRRREFLKLGGAGLAGVTLIGGLTGAGRAVAQSSGSLRQEFEAAAEEYGVPAQVLIAMGYVNTRWEMPTPDTSAYQQGEADSKGTYGLMALVQNPTTDTLGEAAALTGISEADLKTNRAANIRGGAALLAEASGASAAGAAGDASRDFADTVTSATDELDATDPDQARRLGDTVSSATDDLTRSLDAVRDGISGGSAVAGVGGGDLYAAQVRQALQSGVAESL